ncbi:hypothetical protein [Vibrio parahaemolyticus]|uniref:hypothetical protein n=1 Tax=Vibrio parahaemolyticus TaxID=670 RepID=UPI0004DFB6D8|nr:hypothetical protein [Vibrio parahaemolyticus]
MIFDIKNEQKPLIKKILDVVEKQRPLVKGMGDIALYVNVEQHKTTAHHLRFVTEQLITLGFVEVVGRNLFITYEGRDLFHKLAV